MSKFKVVFFLTGSISGFKAAQAVSRLVQDGHEVRCVASPSALRFVGAATFEGLTGHPVLTDLWREGRAMDHIHLSRWADLGAVCPASANTIARMALGLGDDAVGATLLAWPAKKPLLVFPAMNHEMLNHPAIQGHLATLTGRGVRVARTGIGALACGESGEGRLLEPDEIVEWILSSARPEPSPDTRPSVLITGGATREPIDGVRFISNVSTGRTAAELCEHFTGLGWRVTYVHAEHACQPRAEVTRTMFTTFESLNEALRVALTRESFHAVIHAAAVSDYTVDRVNGVAASEDIKLISGRPKLTLELKRTTKILPQLKEYSRNKSIRVFGFKLTLNAGPEELTAAATGVLTDTVDAVVANDWTAVSLDRNRHPGFLLTRNGRSEFTSTRDLARLIHGILAQEAL